MVSIVFRFLAHKTTSIENYLRFFDKDASGRKRVKRMHADWKIPEERWLTILPKHNYDEYKKSYTYCTRGSHGAKPL